MAGDIGDNMNNFKSVSNSAFVLGYTGETGKALVQELNRLKIFQKVVLIGRREVPLDLGPEFEQKVVDYEKIEEYKDVFQGLEIGFCALGTTWGKAGTGEAENGLKSMNFNRLSIFRPAMIMVDRQERRPAELVMRTLLKPVQYAFPSWITVPVEYIAQAMINNAVTPPTGSEPEVYDNKAIHQLAVKSKGKQESKSSS